MIALKVNAPGPDRVLLEISVDGQRTWQIAVHDDRPDVPSDPVLLVFNETDDEPVCVRHLTDENPGQ